MNSLTHRLVPLFTLAVLIALGMSAAAQQSAVPSQGTPTAITPSQSSPTAVALNGEHRKVEGTITERSGDRLTVRLASSQFITVKLSGFTQVREKKSNPFRKGRKYQASQLTAGLPVQVEGRGDSEGALVAEKILLTNDDYKTAQSIDARMAPVEANEMRMSGQISELGAVSNAARGGAKAAQETADSAHARIAALDDYQPVRNISVRFKVGSAALSEEAKRMLDDLALEAKTMKGFVIEVAGFASAEGGLELNRRLSRQRAEAVSEYLAEEHDIPLRRIMTPTGYGISHPISNNSTRSGRQGNRRVEVRLMTSKGITAQASATQAAPDRNANPEASINQTH